MIRTLYAESWQTLQGSFSAVSKPNFERFDEAHGIEPTPAPKAKGKGAKAKGKR